MNLIGCSVKLLNDFPEGKHFSKLLNRKDKGRKERPIVVVHGKQQDDASNEKKDFNMDEVQLQTFNEKLDVLEVVFDSANLLSLGNSKPPDAPAFSSFLSNEDEVRIYTTQIVSTVSYLHSKGIVHWDLKPENILMDSHGHVMLTDVGMLKEIEESERSNSMLQKA
ncbi:uncharacterized protein LOC131595199 [Vicia villosa]|uniref:uncharacterized protein LOC131595198 n=1 Tax=Vicia villosa TaxID=3911 RepID=UPI00273BEFF9|nr:uncharacterized protein LOC131595198 [Vicia villosa]XP_058723475.1 uncharacterized protein LOC131595199 [Vicia villosa]